MFGDVGEHLLCDDAEAEAVQCVQPLLERRSLFRQVVVEHGLAEFGSLLAVQVVEFGAAVDGDGEVFARQIGGVAAGRAVRWRVRTAPRPVLKWKEPCSR